MNKPNARCALVNATLVPLQQCPLHALLSNRCTLCKGTARTHVCPKHARLLLCCSSCVGKANFAKPLGNHGHKLLRKRQRTHVLFHTKRT
jgi:hypothetical protein